MRTALFAVFGVVLAAGFLWFYNGLGHWGTPEDPNVAPPTGVVSALALRRSLRGVSDSLMQRVRDGEITDSEFKDRIAAAADNLLSKVDLKKIPDREAWEYGEMFITARQWQRAEQLLVRAVKVAPDEDRRVNDSLRLARVKAELGDVAGAIETARGVFDTDDRSAAPILPAVLYEIVPAGQGKGHDPELAALLEDAIACHLRTQVDPTTTPGRDFLSARPFHVHRAWERVIRLYDGAGETKKARAAAERMIRSVSQDAST